MKENIEKKAGKITKGEFVNLIKSENPEQFDQMLVDSEIVRNDVFYISFKSSYVNLNAKKAAFAMLPHVKSYFESNCSGPSVTGGKVCEIDKSFIKSILDTECNIAVKKYSETPTVKKNKSKIPYQILKKSLENWKDPNIVSELVSPKKKGSLLDNIKNKANAVSSAVNSVNDKINEVGDRVNEFGDKINEAGDKLNNSLKWLDGNQKSESAEYSSLKSNYFNQVKFDYSGSKISENQATYFIPKLTNSETCKDCKGDGEVGCPTCEGKGKLKCKGYITTGTGGAVSNQVISCKNGRTECQGCEGKGCMICINGQVTCPTCNGKGENNCERKYNSSYGIGKLSDAASGKYFCKGSGKIKCDPCKATGEIGKIVYIEIEVGNTRGEFYKYTNEVIEKIKKNPDTLFKYLDKSSVKPQMVYTDINGVINEKYDSNSEEFCKNIEGFSGLMKGNVYPRLVSEEIFYDVIPMSTLEYNHILSGTMHKVSAIPNSGSSDVFFHTNPTSVNKFTLGSIFRAVSWNFKKAFATKSYKEKLDKKHELFLLIRVAKADGIIEDSEKRTLVDLISDLNEFSNKEKAQFFNLFSAKTLPKLTEEETVFSNKKRTELVIQNLNKMMGEDGEIETPEANLVKLLKVQIDSNIGKHPTFVSSFFKTWQVSIPIIISSLSITGIIIYLSFFAHKTKYPNVSMDNSTFKTDYSESSYAVDEKPIVIASSDIALTVENIDTAKIVTVENLGADPAATPIEEDSYSVIDMSYAIGEWKGAFGKNKLLINIESIDEDGSVFGFNVVKNNKRDLKGFKVDNRFELKEPGDDKWDGVFSFTIENNVASGTWTANNGKSTKSFVLIK